MSKSLDNAIYLSDAPEEISRKMMKAYTDPKKIRKDDPGNPDGCVVFAYQEKFAPENIKQVRKDCQGGRLGSG